MSESVDERSIATGLLDLNGISLDQLADLDDSVLASVMRRVLGDSPDSPVVSAFTSALG